MRPSKKSPEMDQAITDIFGIDRKVSIKQNICAWCKEPIGKFTDQLSIKEYRISGMCQSCQDKTFIEEE